jgi:cysteine synthase A
MISLTVNKETRARNIRRCREKGITLPTFAQMAEPERAPKKIQEKLRGVGLWDLDPANLFRISWRNQPVEKGGGFADVNTLEFPSSLTGVPARIVALVGKWFPTGAHKVGATYGCLPPATSAEAARSTPRCSGAPPSRSCPRG